MNDSVRRTLRTALQLGAGQVVVQTIHAFHPLTPEQVAGLTTLMTLVMTLALNYLEDTGTIRPILGTKPDRTE